MLDSLPPSLAASRTHRLSRSEHICRQIIAAILRGELGENRKLPTEVELAQRYEASRTTVREALSRLRSEGIVVSRRGSGNYVQRLPTLSSQGSPQIASIHDVERYYAFRECVEVGAAGIAATARQDEDVQAMRIALQALQRAQLEGQTGVDEDLALHMAIARATRNPFFISTIEHALGPIRQCMELAQNLGSPQDGERIQTIDDEHQAIIQAIAEGSPAWAEAAMRAHIGHARLRIFEGG
ncbi:FadR/GntR family transcriptional regulator [Herbaspirillum seropedicae]|uniref:FadR/GntR family transcriptional regulator n=1 Tax=Herbaspirillum seropedicae TaxID=964 RepID=UPI00084808E3|nr:FadR/GntR family transcriptional regulator [Herbaspirillum seropedicae]AON56992.1 GntR family transcriptional regulator [Herbaspirillum seropedicae]